MYRGRKSYKKLLLLLLCGIIIGTVVGEILADYINHPIFTKTYPLGTSAASPIKVDLSAFVLVFGLTVRVNFGTVLGIVIGLILYFKSR
ncbi:MAG: DUF4321 domain-containing protein [Clostridiales bacterium]|nr:DUF4321 domain-containing protein [Clostridia bacterium]MDI9512215.1 DUF4321 domain-containing protein [Bacillota bacterium]NLH58440.1 DUF4321 domain-containing protein [Clostridiales bacterium]